MKQMRQATYVLSESLLIGALLIVAGASGDARAGEDDERPAVAKRVMEILDAQAKAWNAGDIDAFMAHYWKSDRLTFSSEGNTTRGWDATKANYKRRYPTREKMGRVTFDQIEVFALGDAAALVLGRWHLEREPEAIGGNFSLVFRRIDEEWVIIHDHTSRTSELPENNKEPS